MSVPPSPLADGDVPLVTPLQTAQLQLLRAIVDARETLDEREHREFVAFAASLIAREAARHWSREERA